MNPKVEYAPAQTESRINLYADLGPDMIAKLKSYEGVLVFQLFGPSSLVCIKRGTEGGKEALVMLTLLNGGTISGKEHTQVIFKNPKTGKMDSRPTEDSGRRPTGRRQLRRGGYHM